jgi:hypothetical protein
MTVEHYQVLGQALGRVLGREGIVSCGIGTGGVIIDGGWHRRRTFAITQRAFCLPNMPDAQSVKPQVGAAVLTLSSSVASKTLPLRKVQS